MPYYIDPRSLSQKQLYAIQALSRRNRPAPVADGVVHCGSRNFRLQVGMELAKLGIAYQVQEGYVLSKVGLGLGKVIASWRVDI